VSAPVAVVVAWRAGERAAACLGALAATAPACRRVLVDNESDTKRLAALLARMPEVEVVPLAENRGFAGGANAGLARALALGASHAILLNDDVLVTGGCIDALVACAGTEAAVSPEIEAPGDDAFAGGAIDWRRGYGRHVDGALDYLTGAALCIPAAVFARVGPFDERLFLYYEDVDWCLRARALGVPLRVCREARAVHAAGASSGGGRGATWAYYSTRNRLWLLEHERGRAAALREAVGTAARAAAHGRGALSRAKLAGVRDWRGGRLGRGPYP
jgi:GT2 family glycosyltransferase